MSENATLNRISSFKSLDSKKSQDQLRQRRHEVTIELRKNKKEDQIFKRRNIIAEADEEPVSPLQEMNGQSPQYINMSEIVAGLTSGVTSKEFESVQAARKMLSKERNPPIDTMIGNGLVPICCGFLQRHEHPKLQFEAAWALTNIASGTSEQTNAVLQAGAVPLFVDLLMSPEQSVAEQAVWALGNIAGDGAQARDFVLQNNVVPNIVKLMQHATLNISFKRNIIWLISNLCRNKNPHPPFNMIQPLLPILARSLKHTDEQILADACWALSYITDDEAEKIQAVVDCGAVPFLVHLLGSESVSILTPALRTVGNIVTGNDVQTDAILSANVLPQLALLLDHKKHAIVKEAAWTISNITAGNQDQIGQVLQSDVVNPLIYTLEHGDFKSQKEAAWAITNITTGGSAEQTIYLCQKFPVLKPFCDLLLSSDARTVKVVLSGLENILKLGQKMECLEQLTLTFEEIGALDKLEQLQNHEHEEIYKTAYDIVDRYFTEPTTDQAVVAPTAVNGEFQFNPAAAANNTGDGQGFNF